MNTRVEKVPRIKKQATYETNVVKSCREKYNEKLLETQRIVVEANAQLAVLLEKGRLSSDEEEKRNLAREIKKIRDNLQKIKVDQECFQDNVDMFDELLNLLNSFFMHERFKYIVKKIPEKKLPLMVKDPNKREDLNNLLFSLLEEFNKTWQKYLLSMKKRKEKREHIEKIRKNFQERNETKDKEIDSIMEEFGKPEEIIFESSEEEKTIRKAKN